MPARNPLPEPFLVTWRKAKRSGDRDIRVRFIRDWKSNTAPFSLIASTTNSTFNCGRDIAEVLLELRKQNGLTQEALAFDAGTQRSHISALERAGKGPSLGTILKLSQALGIPAGEMISKPEARLGQKKR